MASNPDFVQYIIDQCSGAGEVSTRKMFGDYTLYCNAKVVGLISDNGLYLKPLDSLRPLLRLVSMRPPYDGAKPYFFIEDVDDHTYLSSLVKTVADSLPTPKPKSK